MVRAHRREKGLNRPARGTRKDRDAVAHGNISDKATPELMEPPTHLSPTEDLSVSVEHQILANRFSALNLRDRVVIMLLFDQIVSEQRVAEVWALWQQQFGGDTRQNPLWRLLLKVPEIDRNLIYAEAARVYGIETARISRREALPLVERLGRIYPPELWDKMTELRLVPIAEAIQDHSHRKKVILACHDPSHPDVQDLLPKLRLPGYEVRFSPEYDIVDLLAEAFPWKFTALKNAMLQEELVRVSLAKARQEATEEPEEIPVDSQDEYDASQDVPSSIIHVFEDTLVQAFRQGTSRVCMAPDATGGVGIYFQAGDSLDLWKVIDQFKADAFISMVKSSVIRSTASNREETQTKLIKRWVDGKLVTFRVSALPSSEDFDLESIVVRILTL